MAGSADGAAVGAAAGRAPLPSPETRWEVELDDAWVPFGAIAAAAICEALKHRKPVAVFEDRSFVYLVDFETRAQVNTNTGRWRRIRPAPGAAASSRSAPAGAAAEEAPAGGPHGAEAAPAGGAGRLGPAEEGVEPAAKRPRRGPEPEPAAPAPAPAAPAPAPAAPAPPAVGAAPAAAPAGPAPAGEGNALLADIFEEMATVQRIKRDRFRARAYERASQAIRAHPEAIVSGAQAKAMEGVGAGMARRIDIVLATGELEELKELKRDSDVVALRELRSVHGIGAVRAAELIERGVRSLAELRAAVAAGSVRLDAVQGIGLRLADEFARRIPRAEAREHEAMLLELRARRFPELWLQVCGSYRREKLDCGDIDVLISHPDFTTVRREANAGGALLRGFVQGLRDAGYLTDDLAAGTTKYMGACRLPGPERLHRRIDIRCLPSDQYHFGTLYFTGSRALSIRLRLRAIDLGMTLSEYCLEKKGTGERVAAASEREIFEALGLDYLEPHER